MIPYTQIKLPNATSKRMPVYFRYLKMLANGGFQRIKSSEFSAIVHIPSATIRRDFSYFGDLGKSGYGYDVPYLVATFGEVLHENVLSEIALIGVGNLGVALLENNFRRNAELKISCAFDIDQQRIGQVVNGVTVLDMAQMGSLLTLQHITTAISTVPSSHAQEAMTMMSAAGITSVLSFAPERLDTPEHMQVKYIDLTAEVQSLIYGDRQIQHERDYGV